MTVNYFTPKEFECKCGCGFNNISDELMLKLDAARDEAGVPFAITSGCRCYPHNTNVGGVPSSAHVKGLAADIATTDETRLLIVKALLNHFDRVLVNFKKNFIHVDVDGSKTSPYFGSY